MAYWHWASQLKGGGADCGRVGGQWPRKAAKKAAAVLAAGIRIVGFYAEPIVDAASILAATRDGSMVALAGEPGSIQSLSDLRIGVNKVMMARLQPYIYGNRGDLTGLIGANNKEFSQTCKLWFASYFDDARRISDVDFRGWTKGVIHKYRTPSVVAGPVRAHPPRPCGTRK